MIKELLPQSIRELEPLAEAVDRLFSELSSQIVSDIIYARVDQLPEKVLDVLAWQFHIEGYEFATNLEEKRKLVRHAIELHRLKGTLAGLKLAHELSKTKLLRVLTPHHRTFLSLSLSDEERKNFLRLFPELRLVRFSYRGMTKPMRFLGHMHPHFSDAPARYGIRAYVKTDNQIVPMSTVELRQKSEKKKAISFVRVAMKGKASGHFFRLKDKHLFDHQAYRRYYALMVEEFYEDINTVRGVKVAYPSLEPLSVQYEKVAERGTRHRKLAFVDYLQGHTTRTEAEKRIYKKMHLYDPEVVPALRKAFCFLNTQPISIPPYNAEVKSMIRERAWNFYRFPGKTPKTKLRALTSLLKDYKSVRDRILLDTTTKRVPVADGTISAGMQINAGGLINA